MNVKHPAAVGVRQRADPVRRAFRGQRAGGVAAAAQDHQRDQLRLADQRVRGRLAGHPDELDGGRVKARGGERRRDHLIGQRDRRAQRRAPGAQHARVARLDELRGDVHDDVRPGLEVRADHPDRAAALGEHQAAGQVADLAGSGLGRDPGEDLKLRGHRLQPLLVQPEPVADPGGQPVVRRRPHVVGVGGEHRGRGVLQGAGHRAERGVDRAVGSAGEAGRRGPRRPRGRPDRLGGLRLIRHHDPSLRVHGLLPC